MSHHEEFIEKNNKSCCPLLTGSFNHLGHTHLRTKKETEGEAKVLASNGIFAVLPLYHPPPYPSPYSLISANHEDPSFSPWGFLDPGHILSQL